MTTALKQIIEYQRIPMTPQPSIWAVAVPEWKEDSWTYKRFFWRFGIGTLCPRNNRITFINGGVNDNYLYLDRSNTISDYLGRKNDPDKVANLSKKIQKDYVIWNV